MAKSKSVAYLDRSGKPITALEWTNKRNNRDYYIVREYAGENLSIEIIWLGKVVNVKDVPLEYQKTFIVRVANIIITGDRPGTFVNKKVSDPSLTKQFASEDAAVAHYFKILSDMGLLITEETYEGTLEITEVGNRISNPTLDSLTTSCMTIDPIKKVERKNTAFGSW